LYRKLDCVEDKTAVQPEAAGRRAAAYWFLDGLPEIFFGILYLVLGSVGLVWGFYLENPWVRWSMVVVALAFLLLCSKAPTILDYFKTRLTYPRTGYVRPPADMPDGRWHMITLRLASPPIDSNVTSLRLRTAYAFLLASVLVPTDPSAARWTVPALMALVAVAVYVWNRREAHPYSWQSALAIALAGLLSAGLEVRLDGRRYIPLLIGGLWLLAHGIPALVRYLRTYPASKGEAA
jgi:hypothetical protein